MRKFQFFTSVIIVLVIFSSCSKEGPAGAAGPQGQTGATGASGATGSTGATGTANVIYSAWQAASFSGSGSNWNGSFAASQVTQEVLDKAEIIVYFKSGSVVYKLNYVNGSYFMSVRLEVGSIGFFSNFDGSPYQYRYVIIPGAVSARKVQPDLNDYNAVCDFYKIPK